MLRTFNNFILTNILSLSFLLSILHATCVFVAAPYILFSIIIAIYLYICTVNIISLITAKFPDRNQVPRFQRLLRYIYL